MPLLGEEARRPGRIITFYSYKGGTGRSMTLANVAWILASRGCRVLTVDWDLEAPGLHRYFHPFLLDPELTSTDGLIDLLLGYATEAIASDATDAAWYARFADPTRWAVSLDHEFAGGGTIDLLPAGRQGLSYSMRVNTFDWRAFYERQGGGAFLEVMKERMRATYDYVLIDSRTGVSDTSGICTVQFPDTLVVCFTLNDQSIEGASGIAASVLEQRRAPPISIFPVPMRVELAEKEKLEQRRALCRSRFALFPNSIVDASARSAYWGGVEMLYVPYYAYEEVLATFGDRQGQPTSLLSAAERLAGHITGGEVEHMEPLPEAGRLALLARYAPRAMRTSADKMAARAESIFVGLSAVEQRAAQRLFTRLVYIARPNKGITDAPLPVAMSELAFVSEPANAGLNAFFREGMIRTDVNPASGEEVASIADPGLFVCWKRLAGWIRDDREFLIWRRNLETTQTAWADSSKSNQTTLLTGEALARARKLAQARAADLTPTERTYIEVSARAERSRARAQRIGIAASVALAAAIVAYSFVNSRNEQHIEQAAASVDQGNASLAAGATDSAINYFQLALRLDPTRAPAQRGLAEALRLSGRDSEAIPAFDRALALDSSAVEAWLGRARAREALGDQDGALADYTRTLRWDSTNVDALFARGVVYQQRGDRGSAIADFQTVIDLGADARTREAAVARMAQLGFAVSDPADAIAVDVHILAASEMDAKVLFPVREEIEEAGFNVDRIEARGMRTAVGEVRSFSPLQKEAADRVADLVETYLARMGYRVKLQRRELNSAATEATRIEVWAPPLSRTSRPSS
jgi:tetratricopeptide (TPR) repeat protein/Mrp family chromosome partitioning ATPase